MLPPFCNISSDTGPVSKGPTLSDNHTTPDNFSVDQHTAVELCLDTSIRIAAVTGEAGTGKTYVLGDAVSHSVSRGRTVMLCAPTGRAAARIREATGHRAQTCHRLLGYGAPDPNDPDDEAIPARGRTNPIPADDIYVDESSMLSEDLYRNLVDSLRRGACIRFFGDINQLPPVKATMSPFMRVLEKFPKVILTKNFRSTDGIVKAAQQIIKGNLPTNNERFHMIKIQSQLGLSILDKFITDDMRDPKKVQVIMPTRIGKLGTAIVNSYIQSKVNPARKTLDVGYIEGDEDRTIVRIKPGDKILWTKNDYQLNLMNGMIGRVIDFDDFDGDVVVEFEGKDYTIPTILEGYDEIRGKSFSYDPRKYIDLAYAITTHKSQGSEFDRVILMLYWSGVLTRQNFYTAVTRGRQHVTVIAGPGGLKAAMQNDPMFKKDK